MRKNYPGILPWALRSGPALLLLAAAGVAQVQQAAPAGDPARGQQLYVAHGCYGCHGYNGQTGARNLVGTGSAILASADLFITFLRLRADAAPPFPTTSMPNYAESALSDAAARDLYAYIQTFRLDAPPVQETPALRAIIDSARRPRSGDRP